MKVLFFNLNLLVSISILLTVPDANGMFECILSGIETPFKDSPYSNFNNLKVIRYNRTTFVMNGTVESYVDSIDGYEALCKIYKKGGNDYKLLPYKLGPIDLCEVIKTDEFFYPSIHAASENFPPLGTCDFTKGKVYKIINFLPKLDKVPPVFQSGDYMIECLITDEGKAVQGVKLYGQLYNIMSG